MSGTYKNKGGLIMKKRILIPTTILFCLTAALLFGSLSATTEQEKATEGIIRLHVRAEDNSEEEQALKLKVRDQILTCTGELLKDCDDPVRAKEILQKNLSLLEECGKQTVTQQGFEHDVTVSLKKEHFEYREYDGFFLPEGEYESLIVNIGAGEGKNWWCVIFPAACYVGAADTVETESQVMPECFRLAKTREQNVEVKWGIWEWIKRLFD